MSLAQTTQETLGLMKESLSKSVTISSGLTAYDLQAPAKNIYPIITPLRNALPRVQRQILATLRAGAPSPPLPDLVSTPWAGFQKASAARACLMSRLPWSPPI